MWLKAEVWDGTSVSVLVNLFLDELDEAMLGKGYKFIRYADDFVVLCRTR